jgi:hypothetical protein
MDNLFRMQRCEANDIQKHIISDAGKEREGTMMSSKRPSCVISLRLKSTCWPPRMFGGGGRVTKESRDPSHLRAFTLMSLLSVRLRGSCCRRLHIRSFHHHAARGVRERHSSRLMNDLHGRQGQSDHQVDEVQPASMLSRRMLSRCASRQSWIIMCAISASNSGYTTGTVLYLQYSLSGRR